MLNEPEKTPEKSENSPENTDAKNSENIEKIHIPVLLNEVLEYLTPQPGDVYLDGTLGLAGHASHIAKLLGPSGTLVGLDRDEAALKLARERLSASGAQCKTHLFHSPYSLAAQALAQIPLDGVDRILVDIGVSSMQLDDAGRGFSFRFDAPLDMRMDTSQGPTVGYMIANLPEKELADLIYKYGEERFSRRIAKKIAETRRISPIKTTLELAELVRSCFPKRGHQKIDNATRTFQALRIAVNDELGELEQGLESFLEILRPNGRLAVISFHSLEDRIVKNIFREYAGGGYKLLTKKPVTATDEEAALNPRSRSAKLRVIERVE